MYPTVFNKFEQRLLLLLIEVLDFVKIKEHAVYRAERIRLRYHRADICCRCQ